MIKKLFFPVKVGKGKEGDPILSKPNIDRDFNCVCVCVWRGEERGLFQRCPNFVLRGERALVF